ncbi:MAG: VCBS repeat-containing protein [Planctomycetes bacterium]|nr:VCBS repeat-containing protein [Planctomycetota bacterium]
MRFCYLVFGLVGVAGLGTFSCVNIQVDSSTVDVPVTTQPAATAGPAYHITLVDPLYESTAGARAVAAGDIDNDGNMDFASISAESQRVQVHLQQGSTGNFDTIAIAGGAPITTPVAVEVADMNNDGRLDVVVLVADTGFDNDGSPAGTLDILFQGADPREPNDWFQLNEPGTVPVSNLLLPSGDGVKTGPTSMVIGPLDGRPGLDIAVTCNGGDENDVRLFSNPWGINALFSVAWVPTTIEFDFSAFISAGLADLDSDGDFDIVLSVPEAKSFNLRWLENPLLNGFIGGGSAIPTYAPDQFGSLFEATARAKAVVLGDINNDGQPDAASISEASQPVQIHLWDSALGMFNTVSITSGPPLSRPADIALADLNADGKLDIVLLVADTGLSPEGAQPAVVLLVQGADPEDPAAWTMVPGMTASFPTNLLLGAGDVSDLTVGPVAGATAPDILVATEGAVRLFRNPGAASVTDATTWTSTVLETNASDRAKVELTDLDGDGDQDVVMVDGGGSGFNVRWLQNPRISPPGANLAATPTYLSDLVRPDLIDPLFESTAGAAAVAIGDINNDGLIDVASISDENQTVQIHLRNAATGMFDPAITIAGGGPLAIMNDIELVDLNNDTKLDVVVLATNSGFAPPLNPSVTKIGALVMLIQGASPTDPANWTQVDFLGDPAPQLTDRHLYFWSNAAGLTDMVTGDFTGDGLVDIVVANNEDPQPPHTAVYLFPNPGAANVTDPAQWRRTVIDADVPDYGRLGVADIDADGDLDVVASVPTSITFNLRWLENSNNATTWTRRLVGQQQGGAEVIALGDIDGDGALDVAASSASMLLTQWFRNPGQAALATGATFPWEVYNIGELVDVPGEVNQVQLVDLNADGNLDCFVTAYDDGTSQGTAVGFQRQADVQAAWESYQIDAAGAQFGRVAFADFDGNGRLDFLAPLNFPGLTHDRIAFYTAVTDDRWLRGIVGHQESGADYVSLGDVDDDGRPDVAVASVELGLIQWFQNPGAAALAPGAVQVPWRVFNVGDTSALATGDISQIQLSDLNGDGTLECFVSAGGTLAAYRQFGDPRDPWGAVLIDQTDAAIGRVAFSDIDGDGFADFIVPLDRAGTANDHIAIYTVLTQTQWQRRLVAQQPGNLGVLAVADIDGDGAADLVSATGNLIQWYRNPGAIRLQSGFSQVPWDVFNIGTLSEGEPNQIQLVDLDGNGVAQCFVTAEGRGWNFTRGENVENYWAPSELFGTDPKADVGRATFADFNGDGQLDFVVPIDRVGALVRDQFILFIRK